MKRGLTVSRMGFAAVLAGAVALAGITAAQAETGLPSGNENTIVLVQNAGDEAADVVMDIYQRDGGAVPDATRSQLGIAPGGTAQFQQAVNTELEEGFRGVGVLSSDQPINALLVRDIVRPGEREEAKSYSLANATDDGGHELAAPLMFNQLDSSGRWWNSRASIVNVGESIACVQPVYTLMPDIGGAGDGGTVTDSGPGCNGNPGYPVQPGAQLTLSSEDGDTPFPSQTQNTQFSAMFEVTNPSSDNRISAVVDLYRSDGNRLLGGYNALVHDADNADVSEFGTEVSAPIAMKSTSGFYTVVGVANSNPSQAANVQIEYIGHLDDGTGQSFSHTVDLGQVEEGAFHSTYETDDIPLGFIGYARVVSDQPVGVTVVRGKQTEAFSGENEAGYAAVNGVPEAHADTEWSSPLYFRRFAPGAEGTVGYNSWFQVQVAGGGTANIDIRYVGDPDVGCPTGPYELSTSVTDSQVFYANLDESPANGFPAGQAPNCFLGGLEVTSDTDIIVISQVGADKFPGGDSEGVTNAFRGGN